MARQSGGRGSRRRQLTASHQRNWLVGRYAVQETLKAGRWPVSELYASDQLSQQDHSLVNSLAESGDCFVQIVGEDRLTQLCSSKHHQGLAARMGEFPYQDRTEMLLESDQSIRDQTTLPSLIVLCDRIQDAFNFGAILRCCDSAATGLVVIGSTDQALVTPQVARSSAGSVNHLQIARVDDLAEVGSQFQAQGYRLLAASEKGAVSPGNADLTRSCVLMVGSEAHGLSESLLELSDERLRIPMLGCVDSLNAAVATGILLHEIRRQQQVNIDS